MRVAVINFSGNVGKTTIARQLLSPRMSAPAFFVESINAGATDNTNADNTAWMKAREFGTLQEELMQLNSAIIDIGASNVEEFVKLMGQFDGSHEDIDFFIVPAVSEKKQQADTVNTIKTLAGIGVPPEKIRVVFNRVDIDGAADLPSLFGILHGYHHAERHFTLNPGATLFNNDIFDRLRLLKKTVAEVISDETDYRSQLKVATDDDARAQAVGMISAQRLARSAQRNLDDVWQALFE